MQNKLVVTVLFVLLLVPIVVLAKELPIFYIDSVSPNPAVYGQTVTFKGHGYDQDGSIIAYDWGSSLDGHLSDQANFSTNKLSVGTHKIFFTVKDNDGQWSGMLSITLVVKPVPTQEPEQPPEQAQEIEIEPRLEISPSVEMLAPDSLILYQNRTTVAKIFIKNIGDVRDTYDVLISGIEWAETGNQSFAIEAGKSITVDLYLSPSNAGDFSVQIAVSSKNYENVKDISTISLKVKEPIVEVEKNFFLYTLITGIAIISIIALVFLYPKP